MFEEVLKKLTDEEKEALCKAKPDDGWGKAVMVLEDSPEHDIFIRLMLEGLVFVNFPNSKIKEKTIRKFSLTDIGNALVNMIERAQ